MGLACQTKFIAQVEVKVEVKVEVRVEVEAEVEVEVELQLVSTVEVALCDV
jgi:hypothetical protein